jgi:hypothetical protein
MIHLPVRRINYTYKCIISVIGWFVAVSTVVRSDWNYLVLSRMDPRTRLTRNGGGARILPMSAAVIDHHHGVRRPCFRRVEPVNRSAKGLPVRLRIWHVIVGHHGLSVRFFLEVLSEILGHIHSRHWSRHAIHVSSFCK